ncbi:SspB-related isopeptide-forming adhesin [Streptococcus suis]|uniref:SspB-related isopeptide-forming adhesin n=1 Tax=Streptococcus suis TaxID=1307 RepID=UPI000CF4F608|nr:SspB-related isopeptide-forming adhesin [Streptococcus suis]
MVKNKEIFSIRKFKTGTHSALIGKLGVVAATALAIGLSGATASADEVTTVSTTPVVEVVNPNPATNLETVQEAPTAEAVATEAQAGTQTGELLSPVTSPELDAAVTSAQEAGVSITEETTPVAHESLDAAQADLANQTAEVIAAEEKQVENTTEIKEAEATNADIDRQNQAEAERVAEYNEQGQAAVDQRNAAGQAAVDARNAAGQAAVDARNQKELDDRDAEAAAVAQRNKDGQAAVDARNAAGQAAVDARNAAGQAAVDARNTQAVAKRESEAEAVEARNKDGQEAVDARNKSGQAMTDAINKAEQERADLENARLKAEYEAELAKIEDVEAYNAEIRKRNAEAIANAEADNARLKAEYEAKKAEMQAKTKENGYLSEVVAQSLNYKSEPNVTIGTIEGVTKFVNPEKRQEVSDANRNLVHTVSSYSEGDYVGTVDYSNGTTFLLNVGQTATVTYVGDFSASANGEKITKVVARYTAVASEKGASIVTVSKDPTETVIFGSDATQGFVGVGDELHIEKTFYTASGKVVATKENPIIFSISSMNSLGEDSYFEYVKDLSSNMRFVPITGSQVQDHDGKIYASTSIDTIAPYSGHDSIDSPVRYYGSGALVAESGDTFGLTVGASKHQTGHWFAMNTNVAAPVLPPLPPYKQITPEQEKEVPTKPVEPTYVTPTLRTFTPEVFVPEEYTPAPFVPEVFTPETFTPETFTPEDYTPDPFVPETFTPETFTPETFDPITPVVIPYVAVPEKKVFEASIHPVLVKQTPANSKDVINEDGISVDGKLVPKGATEKWTLTNANLKAGRQEVLTYVMNDPFPAGFEIDRTATAAENTAWTVSYDENGKATLTATPATLNLLNANRNQDVVVPVAYFVGRPINDGGTYKNTFTTIITTPTGEYKVVSNTPVIYTPGSEDPRNPGGENPTPYDNLIEPKKDVVDENGTSIDGQSILPNTTLNYVAEQDLDQYKGIAASQNAIGKGFFYVDDYLDAAIDGSSLVVNSIKAANGDDVRAMLDMIHVLSADTLDEKLQALIKESGISPVGEFYLWVAKDPQAFFKAYVEQGLDITYNLSFKVKQDFVGTVTNQTYQIDFGNGYYGNIVTNELPQLVVHKDVLDKDGKSIDGGTVKIGDLVTYKLEGWVIPAGRGYDIKEYRFVDLLQASHDEYQTYEIKAKIDFTLADGTVIKAGDDLKRYTETVYNVETGKFETRFREDFLNQIPRTSAFGADGYITVKRIAAGEVVNEYTLYVNGNPVVSNKVITETPEPPKPETPTPTPQTPAPVPAGPSLPNTGTNASQALSIAGIGGLMLSVLAQFGLVKRKAKED